jgi:hypothetical protein
VAKEHLERLIRDLLRHGTQCSGAEDDPRALVPGAAELSHWDHEAKLADPRHV